METVKCNLCESSDFKLITKQTDLIYKISKNYFNIVECNNCGLNYTNPRPTQEEIINFYDKNYQFHENENIIKVILREIIRYLVNSKFSYLLSLIPFLNNKLKFFIQKKIENPLNLKKEDFFLDIGVGSYSSSYFWGYKGSIRFLQNKTSNIFTVEPDKNSLKKLLDNKINCCDNIEKLPQDIKFDLIRMNWSLEHSHDPKKYFEFFKNRLKKKGKLIINVPNYNGLIYKIDKSHVELPIHLFHFKKNDIKNYSRLFGFKIVKFQTFSLASMYYAASKYNIKFKQYQKMSLVDLLRFQEILNTFDEYELGSDMICVIEKY